MIQTVLGLVVGLMLTVLVFLFVTGALDTPKQRALRSRSDVLRGSAQDLEAQDTRYRKIMAEGYEPVWNPYMGWMPGDHFMKDLEPPAAPVRLTPSQAEEQRLMTVFDSVMNKPELTEADVRYAQMLTESIRKIREARQEEIHS